MLAPSTLIILINSSSIYDKSVICFLWALCFAFIWKGDSELWVNRFRTFTFLSPIIGKYGSDDRKPGFKLTLTFSIVGIFKTKSEDFIAGVVKPDGGATGKANDFLNFL